MPFGLPFPPMRRSCRFIPHLLCAADTSKEVLGSCFRGRVGKTEQALRELTQALGGQITTERKKGRSLLKTKHLVQEHAWQREQSWNEDEQQARALSSPELAQRYALARQEATWTNWETEFHYRQRGGGTSEHAVVTKTWTSSSSARVYLKL